MKTGGEGTTEDEMFGWHHWLDGHEFEQALGVGDGEGGLACCRPWGCKESNMTEWLNWKKLNERWPLLILSLILNLMYVLSNLIGPVWPT